MNMKDTAETAGEQNPIMEIEIDVPGQEGRLEVWFLNTGRWGTVSSGGLINVDQV